MAEDIQPGKAFQPPVEARRSTVRKQKRRDHADAPETRSSMRSTKSSSSKSFRRGFSLRQKSVEEIKMKSPTELSTEEASPGLLKIFGDTICPGAHYKSVLASVNSTAKELVKEALERYGVDKTSAGKYVLCDVIGKFAQDSEKRESSKWTTECLRIIGDNEQPLILQSYWKPDEGFCRRFELHEKEEVTTYDDDTTTHGLNANARKMLIMQTRPEAVQNRKEQFLRELSNSEMPKFRSTPDLCGGDKGLTTARIQADLERQTCQSGLSGSESSTYSVKAPLEFPYFITLRGYDLVNDFVLYTFQDQITLIGSGSNGEHKLDIVLSAPDILHQHCWVCQDLEDNPQHVTIKPFTGATVGLNGVPVSLNGSTLHPGDIITLGTYYVFLFKDPIIMAEMPRNLPWLSQLGHPQSPQVRLKSDTDLPSPAKPPTPCSAWRKQKRREYESDNTRLKLSYSLDQEDLLLEHIMECMDNSPTPYPLCPAYLSAMTVEYAAVTYDQVHLRALLLKMATAMQTRVWAKAKLVSDKQPNRHVDKSTYIYDVLDDLEPVIVWLNNSVEFYQFLQEHQSDILMEAEKALPPGTRDSIVNAEDESLALLEDVVMYGFQQTVYYITKALYLSLPAVLECNPFADGDSVQEDQPKPAGTIQSMVNTFQAALEILERLKVHKELIHSLFSYLFFFVNTSLFNSLMEKDVGHKYYKWSKGVQIRGNMDAIDGWASEHGMQEVADKYLGKIDSLANLLATPRVQLQQAEWHTIRRDFPSLNKAQLHKVLSEYKLGNEAVRPKGWFPPPEDIDDALRLGDLPESFNNHPPLHIPSEGFKMDLHGEIEDQSFHDIIHEIRSLLGEKDDDVDSGLSVSHTMPQSPNTPRQPSYDTQSEDEVTRDSFAPHDQRNTSKPVGKHGLKPLRIPPPARMFTTGYRTNSFRAATTDKMAEKDSKVDQSHRKRLEDSGYKEDFISEEPAQHCPPYGYEPKCNEDDLVGNNSVRAEVDAEPRLTSSFRKNREKSDSKEQNAHNVISMNNWSLGKASGAAQAPRHRTQAPAENGDTSTTGIRCVRAAITRPKVPPPPPIIPPKPYKKRQPSPEASSSRKSWPQPRNDTVVDVGVSLERPDKVNRATGTDAVRPKRDKEQHGYSSQREGSGRKIPDVALRNPSVERRKDNGTSRDLSRERREKRFSAPVGGVHSDLQEGRDGSTQRHLEPVIHEEVAPSQMSPFLSKRLRAKAVVTIQGNSDRDDTNNVNGATDMSPDRSEPYGYSRSELQEKSRVIASSQFKRDALSDIPPKIPPKDPSIERPLLPSKVDQSEDDVPPALPPRTNHIGGSYIDIKPISPPQKRTNPPNPLVGNVAAKRNLFSDPDTTNSAPPRPLSFSGGYGNGYQPRSPERERNAGDRPSRVDMPRNREKTIDNQSSPIRIEPVTTRRTSDTKSRPYSYPVKWDKDGIEDSLRSPERPRKVGFVDITAGRQRPGEDHTAYVDVNKEDGGQPNGLRVLPVTTESPTLEEQGISADMITLNESNDDDAVFVVDLERGDRGIGLGLIDGLFTPLRKAGIYVRTIVPNGNAEKDGRLRLGDRILAVNGTSVVGADYNSAMHVIKGAGANLRFLVAKSDIATAVKLSASSC
ncbi:ras-associating and dilute domain-containing protein-like isoform X2 [Lineus longissimus]|uniref:ras-associating and dilute domain-containing protein-like isoform X2 n=1 Tax=Lineus longissimus TaxID=88925 RepID=UPI00315D1C2D